MQQNERINCLSEQVEEMRLAMHMQPYKVNSAAMMMPTIKPVSFPTLQILLSRGHSPPRSQIKTSPVV